jgi:hypothetical protein
MWGKGEGGDFGNLPGSYNGAESRRLNRYIAARLGPVPGWSMGIGWDVEFWVNETKLKWWLDDLIPQIGGWHHWIQTSVKEALTSWNNRRLKFPKIGCRKPSGELGF